MLLIVVEDFARTDKSAVPSSAHRRPQLTSTVFEGASTSATAILYARDFFFFLNFRSFRRLRQAECNVALHTISDAVKAAKTGVKGSVVAGDSDSIISAICARRCHNGLHALVGLDEETIGLVAGVFYDGSYDRLAHTPAVNK